MILKLIYTLFIGILLAVFVGMGIEAFYAPPKAPEFPAYNPYRSDIGGPTVKEMTPEDKQKADEYDAKQKTYQSESTVYNRNASIIILVAAIAILVVSLAFAPKLHELADGLLLGGVLTLVYGIGRAFWGVESDKYRFLTVTLGLIIGLILGYIKFVKPNKPAPKGPLRG